MKCGYYNPSSTMPKALRVSVDTGAEKYVLRVIHFLKLHKLAFKHYVLEDGDKTSINVVVNVKNNHRIHAMWEFMNSVERDERFQVHTTFRDKARHFCYHINNVEPL